MKHRSRAMIAAGAAVMGLAVLFAGAAAAEKGAAPSAPAGKPPALKLNVYFPADFTDAGYQKAVFQQVLSSWVPKRPVPSPGKKTVVIARIANDGRLLGLDFNLRSGSAPFDASALDAVKKAAPFKPFPKAYRQPSIEVHWHFEVGG